jgi:hypothetical protein
VPLCLTAPDYERTLLEVNLTPSKQANLILPYRGIKGQDRCRVAGGIRFRRGSKEGVFLLYWRLRKRK